MICSCEWWISEYGTLVELYRPVAYRVRGVHPPPPPKFQRPSKIVTNSTRLWKLLNIAEFRTPTPRDFRKKGSKILKLPSVRNCFTSAMANKLVVIINSLKVPKIKKILLYEMKFLVPNYSCLQNPWLWGLPPPDPRSLCPMSSTEFVEPPLPEQNSWVRHWYRQGNPSHSVNILSHSHSVAHKSNTDWPGIEIRPPPWEAGQDAAEKHKKNTSLW